MYNELHRKSEELRITSHQIFNGMDEVIKQMRQMSAEVDDYIKKQADAIAAFKKFAIKRG